LKYLTADKKVEQKQRKKIDYQAQIKKIDEKLERIIGLYGDGKFQKEMLDKQVDILNIEKEELLKKQNEDSKNQNSITQEEIEELVIDISNADFSTKQATVQKLIKRINVDGEDINVEWNF